MLGTGDGKAHPFTPDLSGADLVPAGLFNANLARRREEWARIPIRGINLSGANLSHANLIFADLTNANLQTANLNHANLSQAVLSGG